MSGWTNVMCPTRIDFVHAQRRMYRIITTLSVTRRPECLSIMYMSYYWHTAILQPSRRIFLCWFLLQAIPYVNGTLYSLLAHPQLNHEAKHMGLCGVLEYYLKVSVWSVRGICSVRSWMVKEFSTAQTCRWNAWYCLSDDLWHDVLIQVYYQMLSTSL